MAGDGRVDTDKDGGGLGIEGSDGTVDRDKDGVGTGGLGIEGGGGMNRDYRVRQAGKGKVEGWMRSRVGLECLNRQKLITGKQGRNWWIGARRLAR